jgi:dTDP-4-amino-4,6-dideoxygalactose transaminase
MSFFKNNPINGVGTFKNSTMAALLRFPVYIRDADQKKRLLQQSEKQGLGITPAYPLPIDKLPELAGSVSGKYPMAAECAQSIVTLPVHCFTNNRDMRKITDFLRATGKQDCGKPDSTKECRR